MNDIFCNENTPTVFDAPRQTAGQFTPIPRPSSTLSERIAPLDIDINDIDVNNPSAGVYADLYQKCSPISAAFSRHRHQTSCLVHGDTAPLRGNQHAPHGLRTAAKSSKSQPVLQPLLGHHHDDNCARHRRCAGDVLEKGEGESSGVLAQEDLCWRGDSRRVVDPGGCHWPLFGDSCTAIIQHNCRIPHEQTARKYSSQTGPSSLEQNRYGLPSWPPLKTGVTESSNLSAVCEQRRHLGEINESGEHNRYDLDTQCKHLQPTADCANVSRFEIPHRGNDMDGNAIIERCRDYETRFSYYVDDSDNGGSPDESTYNSAATSCVPVTATGPLEVRIPPPDTFFPPCHSAPVTLNTFQQCNTSAWRNQRGDASSLADDDARLMTSLNLGASAHFRIDEASYDRHERHKHRRHIRRRRCRREEIVADRDIRAADPAPSDASATSGSAADLTDLTWVEQPVKPPTSPPPPLSPPVPDIPQRPPPPQPPSPQLDVAKLETEVIVTSRVTCHVSRDVCSVTTLNTLIYFRGTNKLPSVLRHRN